MRWPGSELRRLDDLNQLVDLGKMLGTYVVELESGALPESRALQNIAD